MEASFLGEKARQSFTSGQRYGRIAEHRAELTIRLAGMRTKGAITDGNSAACAALYRRVPSAFRGFF